MPAQKLSSDLVNTAQDWKGIWCLHVGAGGGIPHHGPPSVLVMFGPPKLHYFHLVLWSTINSKDGNGVVKMNG